MKRHRQTPFGQVRAAQEPFDLEQGAYSGGMIAGMPTAIISESAAALPSQLFSRIV